jgi:V/A-type H+/Na+-transporting ATPase subunit C
MLGGVTEYASVNSRVRALYSGMLTAQDWVRLSEAPDLAALVAALKETVYGPYIGNLEDRNLTPKRAVYEIKRHLADVYSTVIHSPPARMRNLLTQLYRHFEVGNLKAVLRGVVLDASWDQIRYVLFPFGSMTVIPAQAMVEAESVGSAVEMLRGTPYYDTLAVALSRYTSEQSLFPIEVALDLYYWRTLWSEVTQLKGEDATQGRRIVGSLLDMTNLMWAIRYRVYHQLSEEEVINYTLPFGYRVRDEDVRAVAAGADIARVVERAFPSLHDVGALLQNPHTGLPDLELQFQRRVIEQCQSAFSGYPFHVGVPLAYLTMNEMEIQDLTVLIEAKAARMPAEEFQSHLVMGSAPK